MEHWESIIKDKLATYESPLPEGCFTCFESKAPLANSGRKNHYSLGFTTIAAAVGVVLVILFSLKRQIKSEKTVLSNEMLIAVETVPETAVAFVPKPSELPMTTRKTHSDDALKTPSPQELKDTPTPNAVSPMSNVSDTATVDNQKNEEDPSIVLAPTQGPIRPVHVPSSGLKTAGIGSVCLLAVALTTKEIINRTETMNSGSLSSGSRFYPPFRGGISVGISLSESTRITTGLVYSYYYTERNSDTKTVQSVHYLGVPLRLDWSFVSRSRIEFYLGAGVEANECLAATLAGNKLVHKDRMDFSLQGVLGAQWLASNRIGFYLEPTISWLPSPETLELKTYRTEHPVMLSVAIGCRWLIN